MRFVHTESIHNKCLKAFYHKKHAVSSVRPYWQIPVFSHSYGTIQFQYVIQTEDFLKTPKRLLGFLAIPRTDSSNRDDNCTAQTQNLTKSVVFGLVNSKNFIVLLKYDKTRLQGFILQDTGACFTSAILEHWLKGTRFSLITKHFSQLISE